MTSAYETAEKLIDSVWGDTALPVDPAYLCESIQVYRGDGEARRAYPIRVDVITSSDLDDNQTYLSGCAFFDSLAEEFVVKYNEDEPPNRQRFTLAHELGHVVMGHLRDGVAKKDRTIVSDKMDCDEVEANQFAAEIVIPKKMLKEKISELRLYRAADLASLFGVSEQAMYYRMKNLGIL